MQSGWNAVESACVFLPDFSEVDLVWFTGTIKCSVVGKPLVQYVVFHNLKHGQIQCTNNRTKLVIHFILRVFRKNNLYRRSQKDLKIQKPILCF